MVPQKFLREKLRCDSDRSVAGVHATPDAVFSSSVQGHVCISATVNRCRRRMVRRHSGDSEVLVELQWMKVLKSSDRIRTAEEAVQ